MFGFPNGGRSTGYSGSESYRYIDPLINGRGRILKIVTPFIGPSYSEMLIRASKGKKIRIIVSERPGTELGAQRKAVGLLASKTRRVDASPLAILILLCGITFALKFQLVLVAGLFAVTAVAAYFTFFYGAAYGNLELRVLRDRFIHEKLYIAEDMAIVGSANLTYSGTHKNIEHIELIRDPQKIRELSEHFDSLWKTQG